MWSARLPQPISKEAFIISQVENCKEAARHERAVAALTRRTGIPLAEVRALFAEEFARLARGATVRSYLITCTAANVLAALREKQNVICHQQQYGADGKRHHEPERKAGQVARTFHNQRYDHSEKA
jgi:hypothetical protein